MVQWVDSKKPSKRTLVKAQPDMYDSTTNTGRWMYQKCLGAGSYGCVWKVVDMQDPLKPTRALKVCRFRRGSPQVFQLHREAQYSMRYIHNPACPGYDAEKATLFAKYIEDCTEYADNSQDWDETLQYCLKAKGSMLAPKDTIFDYVVLEYCQGVPLRFMIRNGKLGVKDTRRVMIEASLALDYLSKLEPALVHRDIRSANLMWTKPGQAFRLQVLDFGLMLPHCRLMSNDIGMANCIQATTYNYWIPNEAMAVKGQKSMNFAFGRSSAFDMFSLGALAYELADPNRPKDFRLQLVNKADPCHSKTRSFWTALGLDWRLLTRMLSSNWQCRPRPRTLTDSLTKSRILVHFADTMSCDHLRCCRFIGSLAFISKLEDETQKTRALKHARSWLESLLSIELSMIQLIHLAFRLKPEERNLPTRAFADLVTQLSSGENSKLGFALESLHCALNSLVNDSRMNGPLAQQDNFASRKEKILIDVEKVFQDFKESQVTDCDTMKSCDKRKIVECGEQELVVKAKRCKTIPDVIPAVETIVLESPCPRLDTPKKRLREDHSQGRKMRKLEVRNSEPTPDTRATSAESDSDSSSSAKRTAPLPNGKTKRVLRDVQHTMDCWRQFEINLLCRQRGD